MADQKKTPEGDTGSQGQQAQQRHWGSSSTGRCWCGADATPEHAAKANPPREDGTPDTTRAWREG